MYREEPERVYHNRKLLAKSLIQAGRKGDGGSLSLADLDRIGVSATGFTMLVLLTSAGGTLELRTMRRRLGVSKATATEVLDTLESRGFVNRSRLESDRRAVSVALTQAGYNLVTHAFPAHAERVREAFGVLDEGEKRQLADLCRKLDRAA